MPLIKNVSVLPEINAVLRRLGNNRKRPLPAIRQLLYGLLDEVKDFRLLEPAIAVEFHKIDTFRHRLKKAKGNVGDYGPRFSQILTSAREIAVAVGTIGPRLEKRITYYAGIKEPLRALVIDSIGSAAIDALSQAACFYIRRESSLRKYQTSSPISPGMPDLPISEQTRLFELIKAGQIGVSLNSRQMMVPRKSISMLIGLGPKMPTWSQAEVCADCSLKKDCRHKVNMGS